MTDSPVRKLGNSAAANGSGQHNGGGEGRHVLTDIVDKLHDSSNGANVSIGEVVDGFEDRGFGALCTIIALIASLPLVGGIPGVSVLTGSLLLLIAGQYLFGRKSPWVPAFMRNRSISADKMEKAADKSRPYTMWIDRLVKPRIDILVGGEVQRRFIAGAICVLALTMFPLAFVPWGVQAPAGAIMFFGIAIIGRDGLFAALGYALMALTAFLIYYFRGSISAVAGYLVGSF